MTRHKMVSKLQAPSHAIGMTLSERTVCIADQVVLTTMLPVRPHVKSCCLRARYTPLHSVTDWTLATAESVLRLACKVFDTEIACITMLTGDAYTIINGTGLAPGPAPAQWGFCGWSFLNSWHELLVVEDLQQDLR